MYHFVFCSNSDICRLSSPFLGLIGRLGDKVDIHGIREEPAPLNACRTQDDKCARCTSQATRAVGAALK